MVCITYCVETIQGATKLGLCGEDSTEGTRGCGLGSRKDRWKTLLEPYNLSFPGTCWITCPTALRPRCRRRTVPIDSKNRGRHVLSFSPSENVSRSAISGVHFQISLSDVTQIFVLQFGHAARRYARVPAFLRPPCSMQAAQLG